MRTLLNPKLVIPIFLGLAIIGALVGASDAGKVASVMQQLDPTTGLVFVLLMILYEAIRGVQWHVLLDGLNVRVPLNAQAFAFLFGEATKTAPVGNYFQNYLLTRIEGEDFGRTSAATTLIVLTEVTWGLLAIVVVGIDDWTWLRPLIIFGLAIFLGAAAIVYRVERNATAPAWMRRHAPTRTLLDELRRFRLGVAALIRPRPLVIEAALSAGYLLTASGAMYVLALGLGANQLSFWQIMAIYAFSLTGGLILPLPVDLGVVELTGVGALAASGLNKEVAIGLMIMNRLLNVGSAMVIAAIGTIFLRGELRQALNVGRSSNQEQLQQAESRG